MKINRKNLSILGAVWLFLVFGCTSKNTDADDPDAQKVERGRLKFAKGLKSLRIGSSYVYRDVKQYFFVNGKPWTPTDDPDFADKIGGCDSSPNPQVEILQCGGDVTENYATTYILRMKGDQPEIQKLDEGGGSVWINADGRWLLFRKFFVNVETGAKIEVKGMPFLDPKSSAPVTYVIGISPDLKTVVAMVDSMVQKEGKKEYLYLRIIDTESGNVDYRKTDFKKYPWLKSWKNPVGNIQPPPEPSKSFVWEKGKDGKDKIVVPELLEDTRKKK